MFSLLVKKKKTFYLLLFIFFVCFRGQPLILFVVLHFIPLICFVLFLLFYVSLFEETDKENAKRMGGVSQPEKMKGFVSLLKI